MTPDVMLLTLRFLTFYMAMTLLYGHDQSPPKTIPQRSLMMLPVTVKRYAVRDICKFLIVVVF